MNVVMVDGKPHESLALYFYKEENMLFDEDGRPVLNLFQLIPPKVWKMFKRRQSYFCYRRKDGLIVELFYPDD